MVSIEQLRNFRPDTLESAADAWQRLADAVSEHGDRLHREVGGRLAAWQGQAGEAARGHLDQLGARFTDHHQRLRAVAKTLRAGADGLGHAQSVLNRALRIAEEFGLEIGKDGSVSWNAARTVEMLTDPAKLATVERLAKEVGGLIGNALDSATKVDEEVAAALRQHGADEADPGAVTTMSYPGDGGGETRDPVGDAKKAAALARKAPLLSDEELEELQTLLDSYAYDHEFTTTFYNQLGAEGALRFTGVLAQMASGLDQQHNGFRLSALTDIQQQMGAALATATDGSQQPHLDQNWIDQLKAAGREKIDIGSYSYQPYGYQMLGTLLDNHWYSKDFLLQVGGDMYDFENHNPLVWAENRPNGAMYNGFDLNIANPKTGGFDPMNGLMSAMHQNSDAAKAFFDPAHGDKIDYLLGKRHWVPDLPSGTPIPANYQSPGMDELGNALQGATTGGTHDQVSAHIMTETVHVLGSSQFRNGDVPPVIRDSVGSMVAAYIGDVNHAIQQHGDLNDPAHLGYGTWTDPVLPGTRDAHALFDENEVLRVMGSTAHDPNAYVTMYNAERAYSAVAMDHIAGDTQHSMDDRSHQIEVQAGNSAKVFGALDDAKADAISQGHKAADDAYNHAIEQRGKIANLVLGKVIDKLPVPGASYIGQGAEGYINALVEGSKHDSSAIAQQEIASQYGHGRSQAADLAFQAMWQHQMWSPNDAPPPDLRSADLSHLSEQQWNELQSWTSGAGYARYIGPVVHQIDNDYSTGRLRLKESEGQN
ncbi:WXG100 family type VII secretion target [Gandjariella thermophila]|uniref:DUF6571 domain-containing protein n=1 Tax=Gandjariella thermophila TaxID=1931992 RepID=A0A4D4J8L2_9PSEU|nr:WXG100 family type VII secretion target [Gandjariella thermophila]GDY30998.1 hypothetical protein GTS_26310 [Gandjariella thermophila]